MKERKYFKVKSKNGQNDPDGSSSVKFNVSMEKDSSDLIFQASKKVIVTWCKVWTIGRVY